MGQRDICRTVPKCMCQPILPRSPIPSELATPSMQACWPNCPNWESFESARYGKWPPKSSSEPCPTEPMLQQSRYLVRVQTLPGDGGRSFLNRRRRRADIGLKLGLAGLLVQPQTRRRSERQVECSRWLQGLRTERRARKVGACQRVQPNTPF